VSPRVQSYITTMYDYVIISVSVSSVKDRVINRVSDVQIGTLRV